MGSSKLTHEILVALTEQRVQDMEEHVKVLESRLAIAQAVYNVAKSSLEKHKETLEGLRREWASPDAGMED